ncbi:hypothetical protein GCM10010350_63070 [Streptomyces galilaeus]|nr:hypothetical protein GCM10010350_63070 [Streptomyces galilaeus]
MAPRPSASSATAAARPSPNCGACSPSSARTTAGHARKLIDTFGDRFPGNSPQQQRRLADLTQREREVLTAIATGWTNSEIAEHLHLAESTVKSHISRILPKIDARDRVQAVIFAYDTGLVRPV